MAVISASLDLAYIIGALYLFKQELQKAHQQIFYPYVKNKTVLILVATTVILKFIMLIEGDANAYNTAFDLTLLAALFFVFYNRRKYKVTANIGYIAGIDSYLEIPTTHYISISPGLVNRGIKDPNDLIYPNEELFREELQKIDFQKWDVVLVFFNKDVTFEAHTHSTKQEITIIEGSIHCPTVKDRVNAGQTVTIPSNTRHVFYGFEEGAAIMKLEKRDKYHWL